MKKNLEKFKQFKTNIETIIGGAMGCYECFGHCNMDNEDVFNNCWDFCVQQYCGGIDPIPNQ